MGDLTEGLPEENPEGGLQSTSRAKQGKTTPRETTRLTQLNPNQLWRELERMSHYAGKAGLPPEILDLPPFEQKCSKKFQFYVILCNFFHVYPFSAIFDLNLGILPKF